MKKIVRLTESDLARIVKRVINEQNDELDEGIFDSILKSLKGGDEAFIKSLKNAGKSTHSTPLLSQIPHEVKMAINKVPTYGKVGPKLESLFSKHKHSIWSMDGSIKRMADDGINGLGVSKIYSDKLAKAVSTTKGNPIELQAIYKDAQLLKKDLQNIKSELPKPTEGGIFNRNKNYKRQVEDWYNVLNNEIASVSRFIRDFDEMLKTVKVKK